MQSSTQAEQHKLNNLLHSVVLLLWRGQSYPHPRLQKYVKDVIKPVSKNVTIPVLYLTLYYINKLSKESNLGKAPKSEYTVFLASLIVADIASNDHSYSISSWSKVSGFSKKEIISMRKEALELLGYELVITREEYADWVDNIDYLLNKEERNSSTSMIPDLISSTYVYQRDAIQPKFEPLTISYSRPLAS